MGGKIDALAEAGKIKAQFGFFCTLAISVVLVVVGTIVTLRKPPTRTPAPGRPAEVDAKARNVQLAVIFGAASCGLLLSWLIWQATKSSKKFAAFQGFT